MAKAPNLAKLSLKDLKTLQKDVDKAIVKAEKSHRAAALAAAEAVASKHGLTLSDLVGGKTKRKRKKTPVAPKYRHPENAAVTWSGRGRQPQWFKDAVAGGTKPEKLAI